MLHFCMRLIGIFRNEKCKKITFFESDFFENNFLEVKMTKKAKKTAKKKSIKRIINKKKNVCEFC